MSNRKISAPQNIFWHHPIVTRNDRQKKNGHPSFVIWLTGLSGAGKSTLARLLESRLFERGLQTYVLDGDNVRHGICSDLGFTVQDRHENIRRVGEMAKLLTDAGVVVITAFISPLRSDRDMVRKLLGGDMVEVYCDCPIEVCETRDVKGIYKKARSGLIKDFTGIDSPYEPPLNPEVVVHTASSDESDCVLAIEKAVMERFGIG